MHTRYEREAYQFLAVYRFLAYALAVMFTQIAPFFTAPRMPPLQLYIILSTLGVYTILKVFSPLQWRERSPMTYLILIGDFLLSILLVIYTNGLNSSFLLYSLTPIMTAALLFEEKIALALAATASIALSISHIALSQFTDMFASIMQGHNLTLLIVYTLFCFVVATVPYRINLNIRRRIEREAIIEERRRIAREIHDGVAQSLSYLNMKTKTVSDLLSSQNTMQALTEINEIREVVQDTYEDIRESIDQLSTEIRTIPIMTALGNYVREFGQNNGIKVRFTAPKPFPRLSPVAELQLLRIAQEALTNVRRHALASEIEVKLETNPQSVEMRIKDNGRGFNLLDLEKSPPGYHGLTIIKERAEGLGGNVDISTAPGQGTEIKVSLPVEKVRL
ncbi:MAG TPA: sensor histidine kinase [Dehalococcoidia bacterium]|jgi:signal transduction histidine kinase|nr:sensor histidine kinase [Dehalococcoidia bacterium]